MQCECMYIPLHQYMRKLFACLWANTHRQTKHVRSHLTAWSTLLSRGLRLGSLVDERMPVPQLLARVFLIHQKNKKEVDRTEETQK